MSYKLPTAQSRFIDHCMEVFKNCAITCEPHEEQKFCCLLQIALRELDNLTDKERHKIELCHRQPVDSVAYGGKIEWDGKVYRRTKTFTKSKDSEVSEEMDEEVNNHASE